MSWRQWLGVASRRGFAVARVGGQARRHDPGAAASGFSGGFGCGTWSAASRKMPQM